MRVALDTNVLVAAFATRGLCEAVYEACLADHVVVSSRHILEELRRALTAKLRMPPATAAGIVDFVREHAEIVEPASVARDACPDVNDLPVLGTAIAGAAAVLVTGDSDLQGLVRFGDVEILSPRGFHERLQR